MFKNLLVHIPTERLARPAVDGSISLAKACAAHLDAVAIGYESSNIPFVAEAGAAVASIYEFETNVPRNALLPRSAFSKRKQSRLKSRMAVAPWPPPPRTQ
jgi:hypothetical protein